MCIDPLKFQNKYRIGTTRLKYYDYSQNGMYFVTICTKNRIHYLGEIENNIINLSEIGKMVENYWNEISKHFSFAIPDIYQVMPNHFHGILVINKHTVETYNYTSLQQNNSEFINTFRSPSQNLGSIIRTFKSSIKSYTSKHNIEFAWQTRFYEHIIRNENEYFRIVEYIVNNPQNWKTDENNI